MTRFKPFTEKKPEWKKAIEIYEDKFGKKPLKIINAIIREDFSLTEKKNIGVDFDPLLIENNIFTQFLFTNANDIFAELNNKTNFNELKEQYFKPFIQYYFDEFRKSINDAITDNISFRDKYLKFMRINPTSNDLYKLGKLYSYPIKKTYKDFTGIFDTLLSCYEKLIKNNYYFSYQVDKERVASPLEDYDIYNYLIQHIPIKYQYTNIQDTENMEKSKSFLEKIKSAFKKDEKKLDNKFILTIDSNIILFIIKNKDNIMIRSIGKELMNINKTILDTNTNNESYIDIINILSNGKKIMIQCVGGGSNDSKNRIDEIVIDGKYIRINDKIMYRINMGIDNKNIFTIERLCNFPDIIGRINQNSIEIMNTIVPFELVIIFAVGIVLISDFNKIKKELNIEPEKEIKTRWECQNEYIISEYKRMLVKKIEMK